MRPDQRHWRIPRQRQCRRVHVALVAAVAAVDPEKLLRFDEVSKRDGTGHIVLIRWGRGSLRLHQAANDRYDSECSRRASAGDMTNKPRPRPDTVEHLGAFEGVIMYQPTPERMNELALRGAKANKAKAAATPEKKAPRLPVGADCRGNRN